jgi:hypothetical protein
MVLVYDCYRYVLNTVLYRYSVRDLWPQLAAFTVYVCLIVCERISPYRDKKLIGYIFSFIHSTVLCFVSGIFVSRNAYKCCLAQLFSFFYFQIITLPLRTVRYQYLCFLQLVFDLYLEKCLPVSLPVLTCIHLIWSRYWICDP